MTPPELRLWAVFRGESLEGFRFRLRHPIGPYILDFYCPAMKLAIEVDGEGHGHPDQAGHDLRRDRWLTEQGATTLRVAAADVRDNFDGVMITIMTAVKDEAPSA